VSVTRLGQMGCGSLNELAAQTMAGEILLDRRPSSPSWWFAQLAADANAHTFGPELRALLSDDAKWLIEQMGIGKGYRWCQCFDHSWHAGRVLCSSCILDHHEDCPICRGDLSGEIHLGSAA
jgi:hypothetical protein